jgi:mono/diheme cytochrome c family protein
MRLLLAAAFAFAAFSFAAPAALAQTLTIKGTGGEKTYARDDLLKRPDVETIEIASDPAYPGKTMTYKAVPAAALFAGVPLADDAVIQFKCLDGFAAPISKARLLDTAPDRSHAYVAIEPKEAPWPALKPGGPSAGPFYLVWQKPELSAIGGEEWPFQLAAFEVKGALAEVYPKIFPDPKLAKTSPEWRGFATFQKTCFACHTLNGQGAAEVGPDLNVPQSPTEYFTKGALRTLIRDPQALRRFPKAKMPSFKADALSDKELGDLIAYLTHMAKRR